MELTQSSYAVDGPVATVTLNRPEQRNALGRTLLLELRQCLDRAAADEAVRAVVLTGAGDRAFCAGADLSALVRAGELERHDHFGLFVDVFLACERLGKPLIGCVNGHALAAGLGLALSCDLVVAADTATFGTPEIRVGLWPMMVLAIVVRNLGPKRAMELFMTGERIGAAQAREWGLVNRVVPPSAVRTAAHQWALELAAWSPRIVHLGRDAFYAVDRMALEPALRHLQSQLTLVSMTEDFDEGIRAFLEKRAPRFEGR